MNIREFFKMSFITCEICLLLSDFTDVTKRIEGALAEEVKVKEPINQQIHRMCLLRVKLMHFVNSLHNYITTRVRQIYTAEAVGTAREKVSLITIMMY